MVVLVGSVFLVAVVLTRLTYRINKQSYIIRKLSREKKNAFMEIRVLKAKLNEQETETRQTSEAGKNYH